MGSEFIVQIMMLIVVSAVTFLAAPGAASGATSASIRQLFLRTSQYPHIITGDAMNGTAFVDITEVHRASTRNRISLYFLLQVSDVWQWLGGPLLSCVFMDDFYSGRPFNTAPTMRAIFNSNIIVSAITLRQKRVLPNSCVVPDVFLSDPRTRGCGSNLDAPGVEDRSDHKARSNSLSLAPAFVFNADMPSFQGTLAAYSSGAYVHAVNSERAAAAAEFLGLETLGWIDNLTRAIAVEISTFTPGSNIFSTLTLVPSNP